MQPGAVGQNWLRSRCHDHGAMITAGRDVGWDFELCFWGERAELRARYFKRAREVKSVPRISRMFFSFLSKKTIEQFPTEHCHGPHYAARHVPRRLGGSSAKLRAGSHQFSTMAQRLGLADTPPAHQT